MGIFILAVKYEFIALVFVPATKLHLTALYSTAVQPGNMFGGE